MTTSFQRLTTGAVGSQTGYLWSIAANWTILPPVNGASVIYNINLVNNPSGYDDIANLMLDSLTLMAGNLVTTATLTVDSLTMAAGANISISTDTLPGTGPSLLTIDALTNTGGQISAVGTGAVTQVLAPTDNGQIYSVDESGEVILTAAPNAASQFYYYNSIPSGTLAFRSLSGTVSSLINGLSVGDSLALPGAFVSSVTFGASSMAVTTNLGTITFSNVVFGNTKPTGYTVSTDPVSGLQSINFITATSTGFQRVTTGADGNQTGYLWSNAANWTNGLPVNGSKVTYNINLVNNPSGYDDIANLSLDSLTLTAGNLVTTATLTVDSLTMAVGANISISTDTLPGTGPSLLTIDALTNTGGQIGAVGPGAVTQVLAPSDAGQIYSVDESGEVILTGAPNANSKFYYYNAIPSGTFAFRSLSGTVSSLINGLTVGDSLALPGTFVSSVTFGASSMTIVTNLGTTTFSNVTYGSTKPTGYTLSTDPVSGLQSINFTTAASTSFQRVTTSADGNQTGYLWSNAANWTNGVPVNGSKVTYNINLINNPSGYDDIANLTLDSLTLTAGNLVTTATLTVDSLTMTAGVNISISTDTLPGTGPSLLTIDALTNTGGQIGAVGTGAVTKVLAPTDSGQIYSVDESGEVVLTAAPNANSKFYYYNSIPSGIFALANVGSTVNSLINGLSVGDSLALPGTFVSSVTFGSSSMIVATNLGTTTFTDVVFGATKPTGYTVSTDPVSGLQSINFITATSTSFQRVATGVDGNQTGYLWSKAANWTNGVPVNGSNVTYNINLINNPSGYDDIANLMLDSLTLMAGNLVTTATLTVDNLTMAAGANISISTDTLPGTGPSLLTIDALTNTGGQISAVGTGAVTQVLAPTDNGQIYSVDENGELVLSASPNGSSKFYYYNSIPSGTFAFRSLGTTVGSLINGLSAGDSLALPGTFVSSVTFGASSVAVTTNLGTTTFTNVVYGATQPTGYTVSTDPVSGLQSITFTAPQTTTFQRVATGADGNQTGYLWSNAANWTNGVPTNGANVTYNINLINNPSGYDDIANLALNSLTLTAGNLVTTATLTIGSLTMSAGANISISTDTLPGTGPSLLTIDALTNTGGEVGAVGTGAVTQVLAPTDNGQIYSVDESGELVLAAAPNANSKFYYYNSIPSGTFAFRSLSGTVSSLINGLTVGDSLALPGTFVSSVTFGATSMVVTTNLGTITFSDVVFGATKPTGYTVSTDPVSGLQSINFITATSTSFQRVATGADGNQTGYLWSKAANWTNGVPVNGSNVTYNINLVNNPSGYDDIANLSLDSLTLTAGNLVTTATLTVDSLTMAVGANISISSDTLPGTGPSLLTIDALTNTGGQIGAVGPGAVTQVLAPTDAGQIYSVDESGEVVLAASPNANSKFYYYNAIPSGTFAFRSLSGTVSSLIHGLSVGDSMALPGTSVSSVTFGAASMTIVTNLGTTTFNNVTYGSTKPTTYGVKTDPVSGEQMLTFTIGPPMVVAGTKTVGVLGVGVSPGYTAATAGTAGTGALAGDSDPNFGSLAISAVTGGTVGSFFNTAYGQIELNADGSYLYLAGSAALTSYPTGAPAHDTVTFTVTDTAGESTQSTITFTDYRRPNVVAETASVNAGATISGSAGTAGTGALAGDTDPDGLTTMSVLAVASVSSASISVTPAGTPVTTGYGTLTLNADGSYSYVADSVAALALVLGSAATLTDTISYQVASYGTSFALQSLTITINKIGSLGGNGQYASDATDIRVTLGAGWVINELVNSRVDVTGNGVTVNEAATDALGIVGSGDTVNVIGAGSGVWIGGNGAGASNANDDSVILSQVGTVTESDNSRLDVTGSASAIYEGNADALGVVGSGDTVSVTGAGSAVWIGGNGSSASNANDDSVSLSQGGSVFQSDNSRIDIYGSASAIYEGNADALGVVGSGDTVSVTGAGSAVWIGGNGSGASNANDDSVILSQGGTVFESDNSRIDVYGNAAAVYEGNADSLGVTGSGDSVSITGAGSAVWIGGNGSGASNANDDSVILSQGGMVTESDNSRVDVTGSAGAIYEGNADALGVVGSGDTVSVTGAGSAVWIGGNGSGASNANDDSIILSQGGTVTESDNSRIDVTGSAGAIYEGNVDALGVVGSGDTVSITGAASAVWIGGNGSGASNANDDSVSLSQGGTVTESDNSRIDVYGNATAVYEGNADALGVVGSGDTVSITGANSAVWIGGNGSGASNVNHDSVTLSQGGTVTESSNSSVDVTGNGATIFEFSTATLGVIGGAGRMLFIAGTQDTFTVTTAANTQTVTGFNPANGDQLDLSTFLAGEPLAHDLSNLPNYVGVQPNGSNTTLIVTGLGGTDTVVFSGSGALTLQTLLNANALVLPPH